MIAWVISCHFNVKFNKVKNIKTNEIQQSDTKTTDALESKNISEPNTYEALEKEIISLLQNNKAGLNLIENILHKISQSVEAVQGAFYLKKLKEETVCYSLVAGYALIINGKNQLEFKCGEGLIGQAAKDMKMMNINSAPVEHRYVYSGLGKTNKVYLLICPLVNNNSSEAVMEFASFKPFSEPLEKCIMNIGLLLANNVSSLTTQS